MKALVTWQPPMRRVLYALVPVTVASVWFFGWRALVVVAVVNLAAFLTEYVFTRFTKAEATSAVFVTGTLLGLSLPPTIPLWIAVVGAVFGVFFGKMVFGGFGRNVFNPALVGRIFIYVSFGGPMNARWADPLAVTTGAASLPWGVGGFARWASDALTGATPLRTLREGGTVDLLPLLWGNVAGSIGETSALLALLGGLYIVGKKAANWRIVVSELAAIVVLQGVFWLAGVRDAADPLTTVLAGSVMIGTFFMATDPVSAAQTQGGRWIYGALVGALTVLIRTFSIWPEGTMFAILLGNTFAPIVDWLIRQRQQKRKAAPVAPAAPAAPGGTTGGAPAGGSP
jgi:Na+-transporting NADH:ubiquinone oxidoreductase subunit B